MKNERSKKLLAFLTITLVHGLVVYFMMYKIATVSLIINDSITIVGCVLWIFYGAGVYLIENHKNCKQILFSMICGICVYICKALIDMFVNNMEEINSTSYVGIAGNEGLTNVLFGFFLILLVKLFTYKFHIRFVKNKAIWLLIPIAIIAVMTGIYVYIDMTAAHIIETLPYDDFSVLYQVDAQYAVKFLNFEVWLYVVFYITMWFALDKLICKYKNS